MEPHHHTHYNQDKIMQPEQLFQKMSLEDHNPNTKDNQHNFSQASPSKENGDILSKNLVYKPEEEQKSLSNNQYKPEDVEDRDLVANDKPNNSMIPKATSFNLLFYQNKIISEPKGVYLKDMHEKWWGNYNLLEVNHSYIQWLFPNYYRSKFNNSAYPLEKHEAEAFRNDKEVAKRLVKSYEMILDFYGMKLVNHKTGKLERAANYKKRYQDALLTCLHNHLRIRRILTHLNNVGFRRYAVQLVEFLEKEIYGEVGGFKKYRNKDRKFNNHAFEQAPLRKLAKKADPFETWALYGDDKNDPNKIRLLEQNCFGKYPEDFKDSVYFSTL